MVKRGDSSSDGCGFESQHLKLDGIFSHFFKKTVKYNLSVKKTKISMKETGDGPFKKKKTSPYYSTAQCKYCQTLKHIKY